MRIHRIWAYQNAVAINVIDPLDDSSNALGIRIYDRELSILNSEMVVGWRVIDQDLLTFASNWIQAAPDYGYGSQVRKGIYACISSLLPLGPDRVC